MKHIGNLVKINSSFVHMQILDFGLKTKIFGVLWHILYNGKGIRKQLNPAIQLWIIRAWRYFTWQYIHLLIRNSSAYLFELKNKPNGEQNI